MWLRRHECTFPHPYSTFRALTPYKTGARITNSALGELKVVVWEKGVVISDLKNMADYHEQGTLIYINTGKTWPKQTKENHLNYRDSNLLGEFLKSLI